MVGGGGGGRGIGKGISEGRRGPRGRDSWGRGLEGELVGGGGREK